MREVLGRSCKQTCGQPGHTQLLWNRCQHRTAVLCLLCDGNISFLPGGFFVPHRILKPLGKQKNEAGFSYLISPAWELICWEAVAAWELPNLPQVSSAIPAGAHQHATGNGHFPVKEHSSCRSATNYFLCHGEMRWLLSPVAPQARQSSGENTRNHWIAVHSSSMSTLLTCQIINPFHFGRMHMNSVCNSFFSSEQCLPPQIVQKSGDFAVHGKLPELFSILTAALSLIKAYVRWQRRPIKTSNPILMPNLVSSS